MDREEEVTEEFLEDLHEYLLNENSTKDESGYYGGGIHVSGLGGCKRKLVMNYFNFPQNVTPLTTLCMFYGGNKYHEMLQNWVRNSKRFELLREEFVLSKVFPGDVVGKLDALIKDRQTGIVTLADFKTVRPGQFKPHKIKYLPSENQITQISCYAYGLRKMNIKYDTVAIMYFDRAGENRPLFRFISKLDLLSNSEIEKLFDSAIMAVELYKNAKVLPDIVDESGSWECNGYCNFKDISCNGYIKGV